MPTVLFDMSVLESDSRMRGIGRYVADLARGLHALRPELDLVALERLPLTRTPVLARNLDAALVRIAARPVMKHMEWAYRTRLGMARAAALAGADLVHSGHPEATPLALRARRVVTCHDLIPLRYPRRYLNWKDGWLPGRRRLDHRRYHSAHHIIAVSRATADDLVARLSIPAAKITVVHNGVDLARWSLSPSPSDGLDHLGRFFLYVGAGDWRKNVDGILAALRIARGRHPGQDLRLAWAGHQSPRSLRVWGERIAAAGLTDAVSLLGFVDDAALASLYRHAIASLFVSRAEGFGYPLLESMAASCPVIASNTSCIPEIAGDAAFLTPPDDPTAIANAMLTLARDDQARQDLRRAGLTRSHQFTIHQMAEATAAVYESALP